jgi:drug/metabolite transporter (DMT)-like permease
VSQTTNAAPPAEPGFLTPRIILPFLAVSLVWGSTWLVIRDQLGIVPAPWSVSYRFAVAAIGMFILSAVMRQPLALGKSGFKWAAVLGLMQFTFNFNFVYVAEHYITSGLVAVLFALLIVPNALLAHWWLGVKSTRAFWLGSAIATAGIGLLILQEYRANPVGGTAILMGTGFTLCAVACASVSNVIQANDAMKRHPVVPLLAWAMLFGAMFDAAYAWTLHGAPVIEMRASYLGGVLYLGIVGTVLTFPLYFNLIRNIGPGKAAYTSVLIPVVAMILSTLFEGYRWSTLAGAGAALAITGLIVAMKARKA